MFLTFSTSHVHIYILAWEQRADLPVRFQGWCCSGLSHAILGRCTKVPVSARGFRKQLQRRDLLPESAVSGRLLQGLSPSSLMALTLAVIHLVTAMGRCHGVVWPCWQVGSDAIVRSPPPPSSHLQATRQMLFPAWAKNNLHVAYHYLLLCWGGAVCALCTLYSYISEGFWDLCNFHLPCLHSVIMVDMSSACS